MITYYLGDAEVKGYAQDLANRLSADPFPGVWVALGQSGNKMAAMAAELLPDEFRRRLRVIRATWDRTSCSVEFLDSFEAIDLATVQVLVVDSAIHSGASMLAVCERLAEIGAKNVLSYSLVLKRSSCFIPTFFGVLIGDEDRSYFQLDELPNNRLMKGKAFGYIRPIRDDDINREKLECGVDAVNTSFGELVYENKARKSSVYLYMHGPDVCGYVNFCIREGRLLINTLASGRQYQGQGVGAALARWAETFARPCRCELIELWAINDKVKFYERLGFAIVDGKKIDYDKTTSFRFMRRKILYNTKEHAMNIM